MNNNYYHLHNSNMIIKQLFLYMFYHVTGKIDADPDQTAQLM